MARRQTNSSRPDSQPVYCACGAWPATSVKDGKRVCERCK